jgi:phage-related protein
MNSAKIVKELGLNSGMKIRDFWGTNMSPDMQQSHMKPLREFIEVEDGDFVFVLSFQWKSPKHKKAASKRTAALLKKHGFKKSKGTYSFSQ